LLGVAGTDLNLSAAQEGAMKILLRSVLALAVLVATACDIEDVEEIAESSAELSVGPTKLSNEKPSGLTVTTDHLFWTTSHFTEVGNDWATVYRTSKANPTVHSILHQRIENPNETSFFLYGDIAHASVGGVPHVFFSYSYSVDGFTGAYIMRLPAIGGGPTVVGASEYVGENEVVTDGAGVFWSDWSLTRRLPVAAGPQTILIEDASPTLGLTASYVYYADGSAVRRVNKAGGLPELVLTAPSPITALYTFAPSSAFGVIYWGEQGGAVRSQPVIGGTTTTHQEPSAGRVAYAVGFDGSRVLWADCLPGGTQCAVRTQENGVTTTVSSGITGVGHLSWDATTMYWAQDGGLMQFVH
jgi:hypothetical protein